MLNEHGLIVVGGRVEHAPIPALQKHPRIILGITHLARIIVGFYHISNHAGATTLLSVISGQFYITNVRRTVRAVTTACVFCRNLFACAVQQKMGQLPKERVTPSPPFTTTGIDFAGPYYTKRGAVRKPTLVKTYIPLFICFTRAVHLEAVTDMSAEVFLTALRLFVSRRGLPRVIQTDNGTNFISIDSKLKALYQTLDKQESQQQISSYLSSHRIQWNRIQV